MTNDSYHMSGTMVGVNALYKKFNDDGTRSVPQSAGVENRAPFPLQTDSSNPMVVHIDEDHVVTSHRGQSTDQKQFPNDFQHVNLARRPGL